jgi:hypothetical protein
MQKHTFNIVNAAVELHDRRQITTPHAQCLPAKQRTLAVFPPVGECLLGQA